MNRYVIMLYEYSLVFAFLRNDQKKSKYAIDFFINLWMEILPMAIHYLLFRTKEETNDQAPVCLSK